MAKYKEYPTFDTPPFELKGIHEVLSKKTTKHTHIVDDKTGVLTPITIHNDSVMFLKDTKSYVKMFKEGQEVLVQLSYAGVVILAYVLKALKPHSNTICIEQNEVVKKHKNLLGGGYYKGVCELLDYGVLAKSKKKNVFFINTNMFFNGDRVKWQKLKMQEEE